MKHSQQILFSYVTGTDLHTFCTRSDDTSNLIKLMNMLMDCDRVYFSPTYLEGELWIERETYWESIPKGVALYFLPGDDKEPLDILLSLM